MNMCINTNVAWATHKYYLDHRKSEPDEPETDAIDCITDLLLYYDEEALDVEKVLRCAKDHFDAEAGKARE